MAGDLGAVLGLRRGRVGVPCHAATREVVAPALRSNLEMVNNIIIELVLYLKGSCLALFLRKSSSPSS